MSPCPICQKPVDSLRARHVGVREGKVVAYCSAECQARAAALGDRAEAAAAAAAAATPAAPAPASKRSRTPAAGVKARTPAAGVPVTEAAPAKAAPAEAAAPPAARQTERKITAAALAAVADTPAKADDPSASGIRRHRRRMDNLAADSAWDELDDEPAEPVNPRRRKRAEGEPGGRRLWPVLLALALLGGGGYFAYRTFLQAGTGAPSAADAAPPAEASADAAPTPDQQRASAIEQATGVLRTYAKAEAPAGGADGGAQALARRMAASALSRTRDPEAIAILASLYEKEPIESARLEIAYDLARAGDPRGTERLVAALAHKNVERRYEAARWLALLGDQRAVPVLAGAMEFGQLRLQAAGALAYLAHPGALKLLEQSRAAPGATDEDKAKATIALGRAKRASADELRALLSDKRNAEAAVVLAELGDVPAKFALAEQLGYEHSRVEAARALRRFGDASDHLEGLRALRAALGGEGATSRIRAAEATLLLAGPATWSERM